MGGTDSCKFSFQLNCLYCHMCYLNPLALKKEGPITKAKASQKQCPISQRIKGVASCDNIFYGMAIVFLFCMASVIILVYYRTAVFTSVFKLHLYQNFLIRTDTDLKWVAIINNIYRNQCFLSLISVTKLLPKKVIYTTNSYASLCFCAKKITKAARTIFYGWRALLWAGIVSDKKKKAAISAFFFLRHAGILLQFPPKNGHFQWK